MGDMTVDVDPVADYLDLMRRLFDFDAIELFAGGFTMRFDAMHAGTGLMRERFLRMNWVRPPAPS